MMTKLKTSLYLATCLLLLFVSQAAPAALAQPPAFPVAPGLSPGSAEEASGADLDGDGLAQSLELRLAQAFFPTIWFDRGEDCTAPGGNHNHGNNGPGRLVFRVRPHPNNPSYIAIAYALLYKDDCGDLFGISSHAGDVEPFAITLAPNSACELGYGIYALTTWAHYGTSGSLTRTRSLPNRCHFGFSRAPVGREDVVMVSENKHGNYISDSSCDAHLAGSENCDFDFTLGDVNAWLGFNAGEEWAGQQRHHDLAPLGFPGEKLWLGKKFCGGKSCSSNSPGPAEQKMYLIALRWPPSSPPPPPPPPPDDQGQPPSAPRNLQTQVQGGSDSRIKLNWVNSSHNASGFRIDRKVGPAGNWSHLDTLGPQQTSYTDPSADPPATGDATTYCYRVRAFNTAGASGYSNQACATIYRNPPSARPVLNTPLGCTNNLRPTFTWQPVERAAYYRVVVAPAGTDNFFISEFPTENSFTPEFDFTPGQEYRWKVKAGNNAGDGPWTESAFFTPFCPPTEPPVLSGTSNCLDTLRPTFAWNPVPGANWYKLALFRVVDVTHDELIHYVDVTGTTYPLPLDLTPGQEYRWKVKSGNGPSEGPFSRHRYFTPMCTQQAGTASPLLPWFETVTTAMPTYTWEAANNAADYFLSVSTTSGTPVIQTWYPASAICSGAECSVTPSVPLSNESYNWQIQTRNATGPGPRGANVSFTVNAPPLAPGVNTPIGFNVIASAPEVTATFDLIAAAGTTTATPLTSNLSPVLPPEYIRTNLAYEVATTAEFAGPITLKFTVPSSNDPAEFARLRVLHEEDGLWVDRTLLAPDALAPDFATRTINARVYSLSPFVIGRLADTAPPAAYFQSVTTPPNTPVTIELTGNTDEVASLSFSLVNLPAYGTLQGTPPTLTYTPQPNFSGLDSFTFTASDGTRTSPPAIVTLNVTPINDPSTLFIYLPLVIRSEP